MRQACVRPGITVFAAVLLFASATTAVAQVQYGSIFGRVTDATSAVLPGVEVTVQGPALLQPMTVVTAESGGYRIANVPVGVYTVRFELAGFSRQVNEGIRIEAGFNAEVNAKLALSTVQETVTVTGESPVVDTRSVTLGTNFGKELLEAIPSARDPWVILEQTPGMVMDRQNVGGNQSGQQSSFAVHGSSSNQQWNLDGATITDMAAGSSPQYYDFDSFEEIQISTAGGDASQEAAGVAINFITKSGSNQFRGSGRVYSADKRFQSLNTPPEVAAQGGGAGNPLKNVAEYGFEAGGPIKKDKAWFWGAASKQEIRVGTLGFLKAGAPAGSTDPDDLETDLTKLNNVNVKLNYQWTKGHKSTFLYGRADKIRNARGASSTTAIEATTRQSGPTPMWKGEHQWVVTDRLMINGQYTYNGNGFLLNFHSDELANVQPLSFEADGISRRSGSSSNNIRPTYETRVDGNYYLADFLGGDHSMKFGVRYRSTPYQTISKTGGGASASFRLNGDAWATITRNGHTSRDLWEYSAYFNDSWSRDRVTINGGVRFDRQDDKALAANIPANPILPDLLPAVDFKGADSEAVYSDFSPRLGVTYDLRGNGKTILKASTARYYGLGIYTAGTISPTGQTSLGYWFRDLNGDLFVQRNEIDFARGFRTTPSSNYDPANPSSVVTPAKVDLNLENDITDEFLTGIDHELMPDFGVGMSYIYRKYHNFQATSRDVQGITYTPVTMTRSCGNQTCAGESWTVVYYQRTVALPTATILRNYNFERAYHGLEFTARKRFSHRWLMNSSVTWNNAALHYPTVLDYSPASGDPTDFDNVNGRDSGGLNGPRWVLKLSGMYALPWNMSVSVFYNARDGFQFNRTVQSPSRPGGAGTVNVLIEPQGATHYPTFQQIDLHWDKAFRFGARRVSFNVDAFNLANAATVLGRQTRQDFPRANYVTTILAPRVVRFGIKVNF